MHFSKVVAALALLALLTLPAAVHARGYGSILCEGQAHQTYSGGHATDVLTACSGSGADVNSSDWLFHGCEHEDLGGFSTASFPEWAGFEFIRVNKVTCDAAAGTQAALCLYDCSSAGPDHGCATIPVRTCPPGEEALITILDDSNGRRLRGGGPARLL